MRVQQAVSGITYDGCTLGHKLLLVHLVNPRSEASTDSRTAVVRAIAAIGAARGLKFSRLTALRYKFERNRVPGQKREATVMTAIDSMFDDSMFAWATDKFSC